MLQESFLSTMAVKQEVVLPATGIKVLVRSATLADEANWSSTTIKKEGGALDLAMGADFAYKSIIEPKPAQIDTYEKFINCCYKEDVDAILLATIHSSYGDKAPYASVCNKDSHLNEYEFDIKKAFNMNAYEGEPFSLLQEEHKVQLKGLKDKVTVYVKKPTMASSILVEENFTKSETTKIKFILKVINRIEIEKKDGIEKVEMNSNNFNDVRVAISMLKFNNKERIYKVAKEKLKTYTAHLKVAVNCSKCGNKYEDYITGTDLFFREIFFL